MRAAYAMAWPRGLEARFRICAQYAMERAGIPMMPNAMGYHPKCSHGWMMITELEREGQFIVEWSEDVPDRIKASILPCPFCGGEGKLETVITGRGHGEAYDTVQVRCPSCGVSMGRSGYAGEPVADRAKGAIEDWNRRAPTTGKPA